MNNNIEPMKGVHVTEDGVLIFAGEIELLREGSLIFERKNSKVSYHVKKNPITSGEVLLIENVETNFDFNSEFHKIYDRGQVQFFFKSTVQGLMEDSFKKDLVTDGGDINVKIKDQCDSIFSQIGRIYTELDIDEYRVEMNIVECNINCYYVDGGVQFSLDFEMRERKRSNKGSGLKSRITEERINYTARLSFVVSSESLKFLFHNKLSELKNERIAGDYISGREVKGAIDNLNLKCPLIYNTGGLFAYSSGGLKYLRFSPSGFEVNSASLWEEQRTGVYYGGRTFPSYSALHIVPLTRELIEAEIGSRRYNYKEKVEFKKIFDGEIIGNYCESTSLRQRGVNVRKIKQADVMVRLDEFGILIDLHCALSDIIEDTKSKGRDPRHGSIYENKILIPWEVLIFRNFSQEIFLNYRTTLLNSRERKQDGAVSGANKIVELKARNSKTVPFTL